MKQPPLTTQYVALNAGPLTLVFDKQTGSLRDICVGDTLLWRELVMLVRDHQWQTIAGELHDIHIASDDKQFEIKFVCEHHWQNQFCFRWTGIIQGQATGEIDYQFLGEALSSFAANRIGFCLLHPAEVCAGLAIRQHRSNGSVVDGRFPTNIAPQVVGDYTIGDLKRLDHEFAPGCWGVAQFEGDVFETEDQRDWTDASFKTYSTPLSQPFPVQLETGDRREQRVRLSVHAETMPTLVQVKSRLGKGPIVISRLPQTLSCSIPLFGLGASFSDSVWEQDITALRLLSESFNGPLLRCELPLPCDHHDTVTASRLKRAVDVAFAVGCRLELVLYLPRDGVVRWDMVAATLQNHLSQLARIIVYRWSEPVTFGSDIRSLRSVLGRCDVPIGGGSDANFCELNREHELGNFPIDEVDFVAWSINPQVHATDDKSLIETIRSLEAMIRTAKQIAGTKPLVITPITLKPRFNAAAALASSFATCPPQPADARQSQAITAAWGIGVWHQLVLGGVSSASWYEPFGPRGVATVIDDNTEKPRVKLLPVGQAFAQLASKANSFAVPLQSNSPYCSAIMLNDGDRQNISLANLTASEIEVSIDLETGSKTILLQGYETVIV